MSIILNIGLDVSRPTGVIGNVATDLIPFTEVIRALPTWHIADLRLLQSHTEKTLVVELDTTHEWILTLVNTLALRFDQDCIGVYNRVTGEGRLIGPRADKWGAFNPSYFFLTDGRSLAAHLLETGYAQPGAGV